MRFIGDVHLGRVFKTGVPLNRRGEIESLFVKEFSKQLAIPRENNVVQLGDLFDSPQVPNEVLWTAYTEILNAAEQAPLRNFYFIAGNHDLPKDTEDVPAIRILSRLLAYKPNVHFVIDKPVTIEKTTLIPWSYTTPLSEFLKDVKTPFIAGHFEEPLDPAIMNGNFTGFSGHIHKRHRNGNLQFVGSILPIAFGEESDNELMETVKLSDLNGKDYHNKRVRVIVPKGCDAPTDVDCMQLIVKYEETENETETIDVTLEDFDFKELFMKELESSGKAEELWEKYKKCSNIY